jgi:hypothetical protein
MASATPGLPRHLTPEERAILDFVIDANPDHCGALHTLFRTTKVTRLCRCRCGTPSLTTDRSTIVRRTWPSPLPCVAEATVDGVVFLAMLFVAGLDDDDGDAALEFVWGPPFPLPELPRLPRADELTATDLYP